MTRERLAKTHFTVTLYINQYYKGANELENTRHLKTLYPPAISTLRCVLILHPTLDINLTDGA
jgi:hypothetical protein